MTDSSHPAAESPTLDALIQKYGRPEPAETRAQVHRSFERTAGAAERSRLSATPQTNAASANTGDIHAEIAAIELDLAELAEQYGKLNVEFTNVVGSKRIYGWGDVLKLGYYGVRGNKKASRELKIDAARRRGNSIETLVDKMAEVLQDQHQKAISGLGTARGVQTENITHMKRLDKSLISRLREGYVSAADLDQGGQEIKRLESELAEINGTLARYESDVIQARTAGDMKKVHQLTAEMTQVLDIKYGIYDGKLAAEGAVSEMRRTMMEASEGAQSAKGAIAASRVNYQAINAWIDAMTELEFKYRHAKEDFVPVFKIQGKIAAGGRQALDMKDALVRTAAISNRLMEYNVKLVQKLTGEVFDLVKTPLYDADKAMEAESRLRTYLDELNQNKREWAEAQQRISEPIATPHYDEAK